VVWASPVAAAFEDVAGTNASTSVHGHLREGIEATWDASIAERHEFGMDAGDCVGESQEIADG